MKLWNPRIKEHLHLFWFVWCPLSQPTATICVLHWASKRHCVLAFCSLQACILRAACVFAPVVLIFWPLPSPPPLPLKTRLTGAHPLPPQHIYKLLAALLQIGHSTTYLHTTHSHTTYLHTSCFRLDCAALDWTKHCAEMFTLLIRTALPHSRYKAYSGVEVSGRRQEG